MSFLTNLKMALAKKPPIPFAEYMQQALYTPNYGYYSSDNAILGRNGDFITAPLVSYLFGKTLANQMHLILKDLDSPCIFEFGAGNGQLCVDILTHLNEINALPEHYYILEVSAYLKQRQQNLIQENLPHLFQKVIWLDALPQKPINGVILANEVLDAMPVHRFMQTKEGILESYITLDAENNLCERFSPCVNGQLIAYIEKNLSHLPSPYISEVNLFIQPWIKSCYSILDQGVCLFFDYGFPRHEYYHPERNQGTLMCHYQHTSHTDFLAHPGKEDITAHIDFTAVAEAAYDAGFDITGYCDQASFLLSLGVLEFLEAISDEKIKFNHTQAVKKLLNPNEMGELFKVIGLTKNISPALQGFLLKNKRGSL